MTWTKTPDDYPDRLLGLSDAAYRLHHAATTYANRLTLDGLIPKARLHLIPVPARTRRPAVIRELDAAGLWGEAGDAWELLDFLEHQMSAAEVEARREYDAIRQRIRFAKGPEQKAELRDLEDEAKRGLNAAREARRARISTVSLPDSHRDSHRPVPIRPVPSRPAPYKGEDGTEDRRLGGPDGPQPPQWEEDICLLCHQLIGRFDEMVMTERGPMHNQNMRCTTALAAVGP